MAKRRMGAGKIIGIIVLVVGLVGILFCGGAYHFLKLKFETSANVQGSGTVISEGRDLDAFAGVSVQTESSVEVDISIGPGQSVTVEGDDNVVPLLTTEVVDGVLVIGSLDTFASDVARISIVAPKCVSVVIVGTAEVHVVGISGGAFQVAVSGQGEVTAEGSADSVDASITGVGAIDAGRLVARSARASISGVGDVRVHATESLDASVNGVGSIEYEGAPDNVTQQVNGLGSIDQR